MFKLDEALNALKGRDEFVVKYHDGLVCMDYILCFPGTFEVSEIEIAERGEVQAMRNAWIRRNCRGMTFDETTGEIVSLPLHKFFNVDQTAETQFEKLASRNAKIYEKLDGSMIHFFIHPRNHLTAATCRSTLTPQAQEALAMANQNAVVRERILEILAEGFTPVFEFVAAHNQVVVQYPRPRLVYLISRNRYSGSYKFHDGFPDRASSFEFHFKDIRDYLDKQEFEGYVCHLDGDDGMMVKAKTPWYLERHRAVDAIMRPAYKLYQVVFDGIMDDLLPTASERFKPRLTAIYEEAQRDLLNEKLRIEALFEDCLVAVKGSYADADLVLPARKDCKPLRKEFVQYVQQHYKPDFPLLMAIYAGNDPTANMKERLMEGYKVKYPNRLFAEMDVST